MQGQCDGWCSEADLRPICTRRALGDGIGSGSGDALLRHLPHQVLIGFAVLVSAAGNDDCWQLVQHKDGLLLHTKVAQVNKGWFEKQHQKPAPAQGQLMQGFAAHNPTTCKALLRLST